MSSKSNQNSLNTALGKLAINNNYNAKTNGYVDEETIITPTYISINGNVVNTAKIASYQYTGINLVIPAANGDGTPGRAQFVVNGNDFQYNFSNTTIPTWSFTTGESSITVEDAVFNLNNNTLTFTFSNDVEADATVISLYVSFFTPPF
jgi:hypothetical protein